MARDKFPIGELARRRRLLKEEYVENCRVYSDERENLSRLKRKVLSHRVCARRPYWRSKTRKLFSFGKKFNSHAKYFYCLLLQHGRRAQTLQLSYNIQASGAIDIDCDILEVRMYPSLNSDLKIIFYFKFLLPVSVCLCACFLTWGYMHKLNKICQVIIVSKLYFLRSLQLK